MGQVGQVGHGTSTALFYLTELNQDDNSHSSGACFDILVSRCDKNFNRVHFFLYFQLFCGVCGEGGELLMCEMPNCGRYRIFLSCNIRKHTLDVCPGKIQISLHLHSD